MSAVDEVLLEYLGEDLLDEMMLAPGVPHEVRSTLPPYDPMSDDRADFVDEYVRDHERDALRGDE